MCVTAGADDSVGSGAGLSRYVVMSLHLPPVASLHFLIR